MITLFRTLFLTVLLLGGQDGVASRRPDAGSSDARYIAERAFGPEARRTLQRYLKTAFVSVYARPLAEHGVEIADGERFIGLIPDEETAPYVEKFFSKTTEIYRSTFTPEHLAFIAEILRENKDTTPQEILSEEYRRQHAAALERARATARSSGSDDPTVQALEAFTAKLDAMADVLEDNAEVIGQSIAAAIAPLTTLAAIGHEIQRLDRELDNPVTIAALRADGILGFANPVQRQTLLRQLSAPDRTGGTRFSKPPSGNSGSN